jgi:hypothetical protein
LAHEKDHKVCSRLEDSSTVLSWNFLTAYNDLRIHIMKFGNDLPKLKGARSSSEREQSSSCSFRCLIQEHSTAASEKGATAAAGVTTNDYGRYDPAPAFSKPRSKFIPN